MKELINQWTGFYMITASVMKELRRLRFLLVYFYIKSQNEHFFFKKTTSTIFFKKFKQFLNENEKILVKFHKIFQNITKHL